MRSAALIALALLAACGGLPGEPADAIWVHGVVLTVDPDRPLAEAVAVIGDRIVAVGAAKDLLHRHRGPKTRIHDLDGSCVIPGLIDAHGHLGGLGALSMRLDLRGALSYTEVIEKVAATAATRPSGAWITGRGWDHSLWGEKELPTHGRLSKAVPNHPVLLTRVDGHAALANARALGESGIDRSTRDPRGGEILRDADGEPNGMLIDNAIGLVSGRIPPEGTATIGELWRKAQEACFKVGITSVHDAGVSVRALEELRALYESGDLKLRVHAMLSSGPGIVTHLALTEPRADERLAVRAVKLYVDGAMGSRGAWLLDDYSDRPGHRGLAVTSPERIREIATAAAQHGWQVCTHAIGDRGNREVLDAYEAALGAAPGRDLRFRVEHAQCVALEDIGRFAKLGVIASMQPTHATTDMRWASDRLGPDRLRGAYAWRRLLDSGARLAFGSDFPVESEDPFKGLYAAITRADEKGLPPGGWMPDQRLDAATALRLFTIDAAYAAFREEDLGSLTTGKLADFVVIGRDLMTVPPAEILKTRVLFTVVGGKTVYRDSGD